MIGGSKYESAKSLIDQEVKDWNRTTLSDLEKWHREWWIIQGMVHMALAILSFDDYNRLKQYVYDEYGFNVGGVNDDVSMEYG